MSKPWLVIFEGQDSSGKSTLLQLFNKETNYEHVVIDRAFISASVYCKKFNRNYNHQDYINMLKTIAEHINVLTIICYVNDIAELLNREQHKQKNDYISKDIDKLKEEIRDDQNDFHNTIQSLSNHVNFIEIDTSNKTPEQSIKEIITKFNFIKGVHDEFDN